MMNYMLILWLSAKEERTSDILHLWSVGAACIATPFEKRLAMLMQTGL